MKCARFAIKGKARIGIIEGEQIRAVKGSLDTYWEIEDEVYPLAEVQLLAPCPYRRNRLFFLRLLIR